MLEAVELTPALIDAVIGRVRAEGIEWREEGDALGPRAISASVPYRRSATSHRRHRNLPPGGLVTIEPGPEPPGVCPVAVR